MNSGRTQNVFAALKKGSSLAFDKLRQLNASRLQIRHPQTPNPEL